MVQNDEYSEEEIDDLIEEIEITDLDLDFDTREKKRTYYYTSNIDGMNKVCMDNLGIYLEKMKYWKKSQVYLPDKRTIIYKWINFQANEKYNHEQGENKTWKFNYQIKKESFRNHTFRQFKNKIKEFCYQGIRGGREAITNVLYDYAHTNKSITDITESIRPVIGFTNNGWTLPGKYNFIREEGFLSQVLKNISKLSKLQVNPEKATQMMQKIYDLTSIQYKDIIFAYGVVSPFLYSLRSKLRIMPILALGGLKETGKSTICELITSKFYGHILTVIGPGIMVKASKGEPVFASSTFPVTLDESADLPRYATGIIKTYTTSEDHYIRKNPDQSYRIYVPYSAPLVLNFNKTPIQFENSAYRDRVVFLDIRYLDGHPDWLDVYNEIPFGYIGKHIINVTADWNGNALYDWYKEAEDFGANQKREKKIVKIFSLGVELMKQIFDITLDISELPGIIQETKEMGSDELIELIKFQLDVGTDLTPIFIESGIPNEPVEILEYKPKKWVRNEVKLGRYSSQEGYFLDINNKVDLEKQFCTNKRESRLSMRELTDLITDKWPGVHYGSHYVGGRKKKSIFIPKNYIEGNEK